MRDKKTIILFFTFIVCLTMLFVMIYSIKPIAEQLQECQTELYGMKVNGSLYIPEQFNNLGDNYDRLEESKEPY